MTAAPQAVPSEVRRVVLIDLSSLFHPAWRANENGPLSVAYQATVEAVWRCANTSQGSLVAVCMDSRKSWRKEMAPTYKAKREKLGNDFYATLDRVKERLRYDGFLIWGADGYEADDVIATACETALSLGHEVLICSADKDLMQLLRPGVTQLRTHDWSTWDEAAMVAKFGVRPAQLGDWLALVGDTSDEIKGAPDVGPKTATDVLTRFGNLNALYVQISADPLNVGSKSGGKEVAKFVTNIDLAEADVRLARKLVELRTNVPFDFREIYATRTKKPLVKAEENDDMESDDIPISKGPGSIPSPAAPAPAATPIPEVTAERVEVKDEPTPAPAPTQLTVIPAQPVEFERALEPRDPSGAVTLAKHLFNSRIYSKFPTWESVLATIIRGRSMGIPSAAALDVFHIIDGKPYPYAYLIIHLAERDPNCQYFYPVEASATKATWETKNRRNPGSTRVTFTIEQAELAGLLKKDGTGWRKNPEDMLVKSSGAKLARRVYPGATLGLISFEEMEGLS
jgi:5'-3' exonuclease